MTIFRLPVFLFFALGVLAACAPVPAADDSGDPPPADIGLGDKAAPGDVELCNAEDYRHLLGTNIGAASLQAGPMLRVYSVDDIVTQEYIPHRTNIVFDPEGMIMRVWCG